jgi:cob(I)alamin adenosyltransferase
MLKFGHPFCARDRKPASGVNIDMKYYTRTGDDGYTELLGGERVPKYAPRPEAYGTVDELSSALGLARATVRAERSREILLQVQRHLYQIMTELAATPKAATRFDRTSADDVAQLEGVTDELGAGLELPKDFIVPGDTLTGAVLDLARTITRRAERCVARLTHQDEVGNVEVLRYLNRLSSLLFVLARYEDAIAGVRNVTLAKED